MVFIPNPHLSVVLLITLTLFCSSSSSSSSSSTSLSQSPSEEPPTVYEILPKYGLPSGLLPDSVKSYTINEDGYFLVELENPCYVQFENLVSYDQKITGKLSIGSITELVGIQVEKYFLWFDIDEIRVDLPPSGVIYFQIGYFNKKLDAHQFDIVHSCQPQDSLALCHHNNNNKYLRKVVELQAPTDDIQMRMTE